MLTGRAAVNLPLLPPPLMPRHSALRRALDSEHHIKRIATRLAQLGLAWRGVAWRGVARSRCSSLPCPPPSPHLPQPSVAQRCIELQTSGVSGVSGVEWSGVEWKARQRRASLASKRRSRASSCPYRTGGAPGRAGGGGVGNSDTTASHQMQISSPHPVTPMPPLLPAFLRPFHIHAPGKCAMDLARMRWLPVHRDMCRVLPCHTPLSPSPGTRCSRQQQEVSAEWRVSRR